MSDDLDIQAVTADPGFARLSPEAKQVVVSRVLARDTKYQQLSPQAQDLVRTKLVAPTQPAIQTPQPGAAEPTWPYVKDQFKKGLTGLATTAAKGVDWLSRKTLPHYGEPVPGTTAEDLAAGKARYRGTGKGPEANIQLLEDYVGVQNVKLPRDQYGKPNKSAEYLGAISNFAGAGLIPGVGVVSAAERKVVAAAVEILATTMSGASSVEGKELGQHLAKKYGADPERGAAIGEFLGSLLGPGVIAVASVPIQKALNRTGSFLQTKTGMTGLSHESQRKAGEALARDELSKSLVAAPTSTANLQEATDLMAKIPGFKPTLGQATGAPGIVAIEKRLGTQSPEKLAQAAGREQENVAAVATFKSQQFPGQGSRFKEAVDTRYRHQIQGKQDALDQTQAEINRLAEQHQFQDNAAIGDRLRELRQVAKRQAKGVADAKYQAVYTEAERLGLKEDMADLGALAVQQVKAAKTTFQSLPGVYGELMAKYAPRVGQPQLATFAELHSLHKRVNADLLEATVHGNTSDIFHLKKLKDQLAVKLSRYSGDSDVAPLLRDADSFWKNDYAKVFREGAGGKMAKLNRYGEVTNDEDVVRKLFFTPNNKRGMEEFAAIYGPGEEAAQLLRSGIMDVFAKEVVRDGEIKPRLVETFLRRYDQALERLPGVRQELQSIDTMNTALLAHRQQLQAQQRLLDRVVVAKIAQTEDAGLVVRRAIQDRKYMTALLARSRNNGEAQQSLARAVVDQVLDQPQPLQFLAQHREVLQPALDTLGPKHFENLTTLAKAQRMMERVKAPTHVELDQLEDLGTKTIGTSAKGIFSNIQNTVRGYQSHGYLVMNLGGRYLYKVKSAEADRLLEAALYDPELAQALVNVTVKPPTEKALNKLAHHSYSHGVRVITYASENQGD